MVNLFIIHNLPTIWFLFLCEACRRPDGSIGTCISVYDCPSVVRATQSGVSKAEAANLRKLTCSGNSGRFPWVCCELRHNSYDTLFPDDDEIPNRIAPPTAPPTHQPPTNAPARSGPTSNAGGGGKLPGLGECGIDSLGSKIYGGTAARINEFPWMALLEYQSGNIKIKSIFEYGLHKILITFQISITKDGSVVLVLWSIIDTF